MTLIKPPFVALIANDKGGVGKSTFTLALIDLLILNGVTVQVIQVDEQERLSTLLGTQVQRVVPHLDDARRDPKALMAASRFILACIHGKHRYRVKQIVAI